MTLYIRGAYLKILFIFIIVLYPVRYYVLSEYEYSYVYSEFGYNFSLDDFPFFYFIPFCFALFIISYLIPRKINIQVDENLVKYVKSLFYLECLLYISAILVFGMKMGSQASVFAQIISLFIFSLVPFNFCAFLMVLLNNTGGWKVFVAYLIPTILVASKSGFIYLFLMYVFSRMLKREKIINKKVIYFFIFVVLLYPIFMVLASYGRNGSGNIMEYITAELYSYGKSIVAVYEFVFVKISKRVNGVDVLLLPVQENEVFSFFSVVFFLIKGVFTTSIFNYLQGESNFGMGRLFAIEYFGLDSSNASSFEPSLLGVIYLSEEPILVAITIFIGLILSILFFNSMKGSVSKLIYTYFIYVVVLTVMTGLVTTLTQPIRFWLFFSLGYLIFNKLFLKKKEK